MSDFDKQLGNALRLEREKAGFTQQEMAGKLNITKQAISNYENGKRQIYAYVFKDYCKALGITMQSVIDKMEKE